MTQEFQGAFGKFVVTSGILVLGDAADFMLETLSFFQMKTVVFAVPFQVWTMTIADGQAHFVCSDGEGHEVYKRTLRAEGVKDTIIKFYADNRTTPISVMLPDEY